MGEKVKKDNLLCYIKSAYKKLKSYSYYDNRNIFLKNRIVDFENDTIKEEVPENFNEAIESKFNQIENIILNKNDVEFNFIQSSNLVNSKKNIQIYNLLDENSKLQIDFTIRSVPKSIINNEKNNKIIRNFEEENSNAVVDKLMYYLDIDIMSQIIGTLWVMIIGKEIEKNYKYYTAGNILEDDINKKNLKLFKPYYLSYERWRDDAINIIDDRITNGNRSTMISLDIKEYYYSINLDIKRYKREVLEIFEKNEFESFISKEIFEYINNYVFKIIEHYSTAIHLNFLSDDQDIKDKIILPIGFLPSSILSNWYLNEFDELVNRKINPLYYKRYVDDILIVLNTDYNKHQAFKEEEILNNKFYDTELFEIGVLVKNNDKDKFNQLKNTEIIILDNVKNFINFTKKIDRIDTKLKKSILDIIEDVLREDEKIDIRENRFKEEDIFLEWQIDNPIIKNCKNKELKRNLKCINKRLKIESLKFKKIYLIKDYIKRKSKAYLIIQDEKVKVYDFASNGSRGLIENFKKEILKNSSVFKFLPQKDEVVNSFDSEVYKVEYRDSIHKLSGIKSFKIDRYNFSKFLARIIYSDKLENDDYTKDVDEKILWIFKERYAIEYFFLWDKILNYYLMNNRYKFIKEIFINIYKSIDNLQLELADFSILSIKCNDDIRINNLKEDLKSYLKFVLAMNYALDDGIFIDDIKVYNNNDDSISNKYNKFDENIERGLSRKLENKNKTKIKVNGLYRLKESIRISNMLNHSLVKSPLMNYYYLGYRYCLFKQYDFIHVNFVNSIIGKPEILTDRSRCFHINKNYINCFARQAYCISEEFNNNYCNLEIKKFTIEYNPRFVHLHECILNSINNIIANGKIVKSGMEIIKGKKQFCELNGIEEKNYNINMYNDIKSLTQNTHFKYFDLNDYLFIQKERVINYLECGKEEKKNKLKIGIVNMKIYESELIKSFRKTPNISSKRLEKISKLLNTAVKNGAEVIVFPEVSIPVEWLGIIADFSRRHDVLIICGLEHIIYDNNLCCNYIATILPDKYKDYTYSVIKLRIKNHYSPKEKEWVKGYGWELPIENNLNMGSWKKEYDLFRWKGIDFSTFSCFELANIRDRSLFTSFVDLLIGSVHNRDINYYSNIIESLARDVHCYFVHVNDSVLGDNRIIKPASTNNKNILQVSGGINDVVLIGEIDIKKLRDFQIKSHNLQLMDSEFKVVPPEYKYNNVKIRSNLPL